MVGTRGYRERGADTHGRLGPLFAKLASRPSARSERRRSCLGPSNTLDPQDPSVAEAVVAAGGASFECDRPADAAGSRAVCAPRPRWNRVGRVRAERRPPRLVSGETDAVVAS